MQPRLEGLPGICISLWRRLSTTAKATAGNAIQLDERGLLHVKPDAFGRTFVTELVDFCDYWINVKRRPDVLSYADACWKPVQQQPFGGRSQFSTRNGDGGVSQGFQVVVLEFPEWVTNRTELPDSYIFDTVCDERFEPVNLG
ncbi:hypothetical protein SLS57_001566 [Botryosphaeria dothidea]